MKAHWRKVAAMLPLGLEKKVYKLHFKALHNEWIKGIKSFPPSHLAKQETLKRYATNYSLDVLVETGTYLGDMVYAMQDQFQKIYSIELSPLFFKKAVERFRKLHKIKIIEGDSGLVLKELVPQIKAPALFWLDGHYSGGQTAKGDKDCPIFEELSNILSSPLAHVLIIDDARLFIGKDDYPATEELKQFVLQIKPQRQFHFENDSIIITPK